nr:Gag-Pol polyprotein [Tanacetum cinerariifolium]
VGYSTQSRAYRVFNKRTRVIMEPIHVNFNELPHMASDQISSDPTPECQSMALEHESLSPAIQRQSNGVSKSFTVVSKSSAVSAADAPYQRQQPTTPLNTHTTPAPTCQTLSIETTVISSENINQAEPHAENDEVSDDEFINIFSTPVKDQGETSSPAADALNQHQQPTTPLNNHTTPTPTCQTLPITTTVISSENINQAELQAKNNPVADDEFINIFSTPVQDQGETSSRHVDSSNMHTFYQRYPSEQRWTKDHPLEQVIGNPSQSVRTRRQLESDAEMCMFPLTVSQTEPKNIKEAMADSAWIESM